MKDLKLSEIKKVVLKDADTSENQIYVTCSVYLKGEKTARTVEGFASANVPGFIVEYKRISKAAQREVLAFINDSLECAQNNTSTEEEE